MNKLEKVYVNMMEHSGYKARLMKARRLKGDGVFGLPPGSPMNVVPIHCLPGCPDAWVREAGSYVCPVDIEHGIWFDWTMNDINTAIIPSVKSMNPITGEQIKELRMEQYRDKCPKHGDMLAHGGYCEKCGYSLPPQNYVSVCDGNQALWWDGFRQPDGTVRQFFFTEDEKRDIASLVIGKDNTVPAFGFAFFKTKVNRVVEKNPTRGFNPEIKLYMMKSTLPAWTLLNDFTGDSPHTYYGSNNSTVLCGTNNSSTSVAMNVNCASKKSIVATSAMNLSCDASGGEVTDSLMESLPMEDTRLRKRSIAKDVSVGAGAKINQKLEVDKLSLDEYTDKPQSLIRLYFVFEEQLQNIVANGGVKELVQNEGFVENLPVG